MYFDLLNENIKIKVGEREITLYRIIALEPFEIMVPINKYSSELKWNKVLVEKYEIGGFVEKEANLDPDSFNWVGTNAKIWGDALIKNGTVLEQAAKVYGNCVISSSYITDYAIVKGHAQVEGSYLADYATVDDHATVKTTKMVNSTLVKNEAIVENSFMFDGSFIIKKAQVTNCILKQTAMVGGFAKISNSSLGERSAITNGDHTNKTLNDVANLKSVIPESLYGVI